jgi:branched-subunit amino acid permease
MFLGMNGIAVPGFLGSYIELLNKIPLAALDFNWILPGIVGMILGIAIQAIFKVGKTREDM